MDNDDDRQWMPSDGNELKGSFLCLSQARTWISNAICHGLSCVQWNKVRGGCSLY